MTFIDIFSKNLTEKKGGSHKTAFKKPVAQRGNK